MRSLKNVCQIGSASYSWQMIVCCLFVQFTWWKIYKEKFSIAILNKWIWIKNILHKFIFDLGYSFCIEYISWKNVEYFSLPNSTHTQLTKPNPTLSLPNPTSHSVYQTQPHTQFTKPNPTLILLNPILHWVFQTQPHSQFTKPNFTLSLPNPTPSSVYQTQCYTQITKPNFTLSLPSPTLYSVYQTQRHH